jgi:drug/metabolite transporter (DMT)-like permease
VTASRSPTGATPGTREHGAGLAAVGVAVLGFSWGFTIVKLIPLEPAALAAWRLALGAGGLGAVALAWRMPWPRPRGAALIAGAAFGAHQLLFIGATQRTSIAVVTVIVSLQPLVVALVSRRVVAERVPRALLAWSAVGVGGVALTMLGTVGDEVRSLAGDLLAIGNLAAFTAYFLAAKRARTDGAPTLTFTATFLGLALLVVAPAAALGGTSGLRVDGSTLALLVLLAFGPGSGHLLLNWAHPRISAALASLALASVPALASLWAHLVLGEPFGRWLVAGIVLVAAALDGGRRVERRVAAAGAASSPPAGG